MANIKMNHLTIGSNTLEIVDRVARSGNYVTATTAAEMDNEGAIYVYTGSETGYNQGHLYYWDGTAFVDGGEYNGARAEIDPTLSHTGKAADAKETGDALASLNGSLENLENTFVEVAEHPVWERGSIHIDNGENLTSSYVCRTKGYIESETRVAIAPLSGIRFSWRLYTSDGSFISSSDWLTESAVIRLTSGQKIRLVCRYIDSTVMKVSDADDSISIAVYRNTDNTLTLPNKAADAKETGDKFKALEWTDSLKYKNVSPIWTIGAIDINSGENASSKAHLRTDEFFEADGARIILNTQNNVVYALRYYDADKNFVSSDSEVRSEDMNLADIISADARIAFFRLVARYANASTIDSEAKVIISESITIQVKFDILNDIKNLCVVPEITPLNSMLGNISIKAAKTIYFSDGTAPIIDWYLLVDKDGQFYKSKDLVSKTYLFSFNPPSGVWGNWSAGIMANNDIIFVRVAGSLATPNGRLNDANRMNPVCYLAAENYSSRHVIDFGASLRPCGWLTNVGYLVLPNGDSVFCEYTRGTVKTANVWVVSGDVTDPSSWSTKWSANIIDDTGVTAPGIKHCHEMQYDFYTGVVYFGTGDSPQGSYNYYSIDNGQTWTLLYGPDKDKCRRLTYVFTEDKVYWASDSYESANHHFFIADRTAENIVDIENAQSIQLQSDNGQACYGCVYLKSLNAIVLMERCDQVQNNFYWYCYDIDSAEIKLIGTIKSPDAGAHYLGFRANFIDWYPDGSSITVGFSHTVTEIATDTNQNALCGNLGGASGDGSTRINNLKIFIYKNNGEYSYKASTIWC